MASVFGVCVCGTEEIIVCLRVASVCGDRAGVFGRVFQVLGVQQVEENVAESTQIILSEIERH